MCNQIHPVPSSRMRMFIFYPLLVFAMTSPILAEPPRKLLPVDEAAKDPSFFLFRARLLEAVAARDTAFVLGILTPDILNSFGGNGGVAEFKEQWKLDGRDSELWETLAHVLGLGGKFMGDATFHAPYISACWPEDADAFDYGAILGENVRVREKPDKNSAVLAKLTFDMIPVLEFAPDHEEESWVKVKLQDGKVGYVSAAFVGHAVDWRAFFEKRDGQWRMTSLVAGD